MGCGGVLSSLVRASKHPAWGCDGGVVATSTEAQQQRAQVGWTLPALPAQLSIRHAE